MGAPAGLFTKAAGMATLPIKHALTYLDQHPLALVLLLVAIGGVIAVKEFRTG